MQPKEMLPGSLAPEILVHILSYLDNHSLYSLLLTSKQLYPSAAKVLYSQKWPAKMAAKIESSLALNPENAKYLSEYRCTNIPALIALLARGPLRLDKFTLDFRKRQLRIPEKIEFAQNCEEMVKRMHMDITIREIDLSCANPVLLCQTGRNLEIDGHQDRGGGFLSILASIKGIERIILRPFECGDRGETYRTSQQVLDELACLTTLKHITFIDADIYPNDWELNFPDGALPSLTSIRFHSTIPDGAPEITKDELEYLIPYQKRGIFFEVTAYSYSRPYMTFYLSAIKHLTTDSDRRSFIQWLVRGEQYFQLHEHALDIFMLDLISYQIPERNLILSTIKPIDFEKPIALRLPVHPEDSNMMAQTPDIPSNATLFSQLLPQQLSYLELFVRGSLEIGFIPSLIPNFPHLDRLVLDTFTSAPGKTIKNTQKGTPTVILHPQPQFLQSSLSVKILSSDKFRPVIWSLELEQEEETLWGFWVRNEDGEDVEEVSHDETKEYVTGGNGDVEKEMSEWFGLSTSLKTINLRVFAGQAWFHDAWRPYFEYDSCAV